VGFCADASRPQDNVDLFAASLTSPPVSEPSTHEMSEDTILVRAARNGDRGAFGRLYDLYARMVHGILLAKVPRHEVDDLVQDVFMTALRRLSSLRKDGSFGWKQELLTILLGLLFIFGPIFAAIAWATRRALRNSTHASKHRK
jgi:hypothetical protein